jgi:formylglycine-generating enzyme required for sulfatase activity
VAFFTFSIAHSAERAFIQIISEANIAVFVDEVFMGKTNEEIGGKIIEDVIPGDRIIKCVKDGFNPQVKKVRINPGEVYTFRLENFIPKIEITQYGNMDQENIGLKVGSVVIQSVPIAIDVEIPALTIYSKKVKDEWKAANIPVGIYEINYYWNTQVIKDTVRIHPDWDTRIFVNFIKSEVNDKNLYVSPEKQEKLNKYNLIYVKGGIYQMGSEDGESDESPIHSVKLSSFYIGKYEITVNEFIEFMNAANVEDYGSLDGRDIIDIDDIDCPVIYEEESFKFKRTKFVETETCPIVGITWHGATAYCEWLSRKTGDRYRLPTEAEWQFAARGGVESEYFIFSGSDTLNRVGWYADNSEPKVHPVGEKRPNELGIYDMSGNAWEWCLDWYKKDYYQQMEFVNPKGPERGFRRVIQGGSVLNSSNRCRSTARYNYPPNNASISNGFRVVMEIDSDK